MLNSTNKKIKIWIYGFWVLIYILLKFFSLQNFNKKVTETY